MIQKFRIQFVLGLGLQKKKEKEKDNVEGEPGRKDESGWEIRKVSTAKEEHRDETRPVILPPLHTSDRGDMNMNMLLAERE
jgi:hypothetical protein